QGGQRLLPAVIVASGMGTGLRHTNRPAPLVFGQADFFFGGQRHRAEHQPRVRLPQQDNSVLGGPARCPSGCNVVSLFTWSVAPCWQGREQGAHGFAGAGGRLTEQPKTAFSGFPPRFTSPVDLARQGALPRPVARIGEAHGLQTGGAGRVPVQLAAGPGGVLPQQPEEEIFQFIAGKITCKVKYLVIVDLVIRQPDGGFRQVLLGRVEGGIDHPLGPVAEVQFGADLAGGDAGRFDLVDDGAVLAVGENAVGPPLDGAADAVHLPAAREKDLGLVALPRLLLQLAVDAGALVGPVKAGKAAVDV